MVRKSQNLTKYSVTATINHFCSNFSHRQILAEVSNSTKMELPEVEAAHTPLSHKQQQQTKETHKEGNEKLNFVHKFLDYFEENLSNFGQNHKKFLFILLRVVVLLGSIAFVVLACVKNFERARVLFNIAIIIIAYMLYCAFKKIFGAKINATIITPIANNAKCMCAMRWILIIGFSIFVAVWVIRDSVKEPYRLVSISGLRLR